MNQFVLQLKSIDMEISRLRSNIRQLNQQRLKVRESLFSFMSRNGIKSLDGIKIKTVSQKEYVKRKTPSEKKRDGIVLLRTLGVPDPEQTYNEIISTKTS